MSSDPTFSEPDHALAPIFPEEGTWEGAHDMLRYVGETPVHKTRQHLALQVLFCVLAELEELPLRSSDLLQSVLARAVMQKVQRVLPEVTPHLQDAWVHFIPGNVEACGPSNLHESVELLEEPLGNTHNSAHQILYTTCGTTMSSAEAVHVNQVSEW